MALFRFPKRKLRKLIQQGEYEQAIEFGISIQRRFSEDADYLFIMGSVYYIVEDADKAMHYFDRSLAARPDDIEALYLKANIHVHLAEHEDALKCCRHILKLDPQHLEAQQIAHSLGDD